MKHLKLFEDDNLHSSEEIERMKNSVIANIKSGNEKMLRDIFTWYIDIADDNDISLIYRAFQNSVKIK